MSVISISIVCDGTSDLCLHDLIQWITDTSFPEQSFRISAAREVIPAHGTLDRRLKKPISRMSLKLLYVTEMRKISH